MGIITFLFFILFHLSDTNDIWLILLSIIQAFDVVRSIKHAKVKDVIRGLDMHIMNTNISNKNRLQSADAVGILMDCVINTTQNRWQFVRLNYVNNAHYTNVRFLLRLMKAENV